MATSQLKLPQWNRYQLYWVSMAKRAISWRELCDMTPDSRRGVRAQFMRIFDSICEREKLKAIPGAKDEGNPALLQRLFGGMLPGKR